MKKKWYYNSWLIAILFSLWWLYLVPLIIGIVLLVKKNKAERKLIQDFNFNNTEIERLKLENQRLNNGLSKSKEQDSPTETINYKDNLKNNDAEQLKTVINNLTKDLTNLRQHETALLNDINSKNKEIELLKLENKKLSENQSTHKKADWSLTGINKEIASNNTTIAQLREQISDLQKENSKLEKSILSNKQKLSASKELYKSVEYSIENFFSKTVSFSDCLLNYKNLQELELISPSVTLKLHCMDIKSLNKSFKDNEKQIEKLLDAYSSRYTTKANKTIYSLMVIALRAELQNILYNLKYDKLDQSIEYVKDITAKYLKIAGEGNQSIIGTLTKFIGEVEYLFINAVKIEYNYYVKKEQARQEQAALKEQMKQEAEERKALEVERRKIEQEEAKFERQIENLRNQATDAKDAELAALNARILELQSQLANVVVKKEEITNLQNGKAGNVYIISNLGSFGKNIFKIGMTRRMNPQDRVNELGDASVPFRFDVHSFIFSDDAPALETQLHKRLNNQRVNKVNMRKEFFNVTIEELEQIVNEICPTAEFNKTMMAEEFRQSQSSDELYTSEYEVIENNI